MAEPTRNIALCYVRQSRRMNPDDIDSQERQRESIQAVCDLHNWTPEWYEDVGGHRSGRSETHRPQWIALKARLDSPDVIAVVANDLSRLHRRAVRIMELIELLNLRQIRLVLAGPGREADTHTAVGRLRLQFQAIADEYYAKDVAQHIRDNVAYRKRHGISVGMAPFGTKRNADGYLIPSDEGAWLLPDGSFAAGHKEDTPLPHGIWRGYYEAAERILSLYASGETGLTTLSYQINKERFAYRDRKGQPRPFRLDDLRRIVANWPEYGGIIYNQTAKNRPAYIGYDIDTLPFREDRAVFPIDLLRKVAAARMRRSYNPFRKTRKEEDRYYPLTGLTYCAHCERMAKENANDKLSNPLTGAGSSTGIPRYRHSPGILCGSTNKSVPRQVIEADFFRLVQLLSVTPEAFEVMTDLSYTLDSHIFSQEFSDFAEQKKQALATCQQRIDAAAYLYGEGRIDLREYLRRVEANKREIKFWQKDESTVDMPGLELLICVEAIDRILQLWETSTDEVKQSLAHSLFTRIVYDLDMQRIVDFRLKPWAYKYLVLRADI